MTLNHASADQMLDHMLHRFLELIFKIPFEPWEHLGKELFTVVLAYTIFLAYGKMLSTLGKMIFNGIRNIWKSSHKITETKDSVPASNETIAVLMKKLSSVKLISLPEKEC